MPLPPESTEADLIQQYLEWLQHNAGRSAATSDHYRLTLQRLAEWCADNDNRLLDLSLEQLEQFAGFHAHALKLSPQSRRPLVAAVRGFYRWAVRRGLLRDSPGEQLAYPKAGRKMPRVGQMADAEKILMQCDTDTLIGLRDAAMISLLIGTGVRVSGLTALNESRLIWMDIEGSHRLVINVIEKGKRERMLPVPVEAAVLLRAYLAHPELAQIDRTLPDGDQVVFVCVGTGSHVPAHEHFGEARRLAQRSVFDRLRRYARAAGLDERAAVNPHAWRHLAGTEMAESDVDVITRSALLGHTSPNSTAIYTHLAMRKLTQQVDRANPLGKMKGRLASDLRHLAKMTQQP